MIVEQQAGPRTHIVNNFSSKPASGIPLVFVMTASQLKMLTDNEKIRLIKSVFIAAEGDIYYTVTRNIEKSSLDVSISYSRATTRTDTEAAAGTSFRRDELIRTLLGIAI